MQNAVKIEKWREQKREKNFIDFISDVSKPDTTALVDEFKTMLKSDDAKKLGDWFSNNGYSIDIEECEKIIKNREHLQNFNTKIKSLQY